MLNKIVARRTEEGLMAWIPTLGFWVRVTERGRDYKLAIQRHLTHLAVSRNGNAKDLYNKMQDAMALPIVMQPDREVPRLFREPKVEA